MDASQPKHIHVGSSHFIKFATPSNQSQHSSELSCVGAFAATVGLPCHITLVYDALRRVGAVSRLIAMPTVSEDTGLPTVPIAFGKLWWRLVSYLRLQT